MSAGVRWLDAPGEAAGWRGEPLAWVIAPDDARRAGWLGRAAPTAADLADFAGRGDAALRIERRRLTRLLLAIATGGDPAAIAIARGGHGAPLLAPGLHLSVAGSGGWTAIAIANEAIGIDVERIAADPPLWDMLTAAEGEGVRADPDPPAAWLRCWTAKEAHAKRLGEPLRADPASIDTAAGTARSPQGTSRIETRHLDGAIVTVATRPR